MIWSDPGGDTRRLAAAGGGGVANLPEHHDRKIYGGGNFAVGAAVAPTPEQRRALFAKYGQKEIEKARWSLWFRFNKLHHKDVLADIAKKGYLKPSNRHLYEMEVPSSMRALLKVPTDEEIGMALKGKELSELFEAKMPALGTLQDFLLSLTKGYVVSELPPADSARMHPDFDKLWKLFGKSWFKAPEKEVPKQYRKLRQIDGRRVKAISEHSVLNYRLQGSGAVICKAWVVNVYTALIQAGLRHGWDASCDFAMVAWVHDEVLIAVRPQHGELVQKVCLEQAIATGRAFKLACPIEADAKIGRSWKDVH
jgi:hypothetical protein